MVVVGAWIGLLIAIVLLFLVIGFMTTPSSPDWDCNCDATEPTPHVPDGIVNMRDVGEAASNFGKT